MGPFLPSLGTYMAQEWSKIWLFLGQNQATMAGWFQGGDPAWKVFSAPRGSVVSLEDTISRRVFLIKGERVTLNAIPGMGRRWQDCNDDGGPRLKCQG